MREIATVLCVIGILGLFWLDQDRENRPSKGLWVPTIFLLIDCSRPVSIWLGIAPAASMSTVYAEGNPVERAVGIVFLASALIVLVKRRDRVGPLLRENQPILLFFAFALLSFFWSDFPLITFKHWIKGIDDVAMVLIVATEIQLKWALKRLFARTAFILIPLSLLFSKYYPELGRIGTRSWTTEYCGVTLNKNELGCTCLVLGLGILWCFVSAWQDREEPRRKRLLLAHGAVLGIISWLFLLMDSMTSTSVIVMTGFVLIWVSRRAFRRNALKLHTLVAGVVGLSLVALFFDPGGGLVGTLGRDPTLTGRTNIWHIVLNVAHSPVLGVGYESFWLGSRLTEVQQLANQTINEAHNGYIEIYLSLGWIGIALLAGIIATGYRRIIAALRANVETANLSLSLFLACVLYSLTEAGFRMQTPAWIFFLLGIFLASPAVIPDEASRNNVDGSRDSAESAQTGEEIAAGISNLDPIY